MIYMPHHLEGQLVHTTTIPPVQVPDNSNLCSLFCMNLSVICSISSGFSISLLVNRAIFLDDVPFSSV